MLKKVINYLLYANVSKSDYKKINADYMASNHIMLTYLSILSAVVFGACIIIGIFVPNMQTKLDVYRFGFGFSIAALALNMIGRKSKICVSISMVLFELALLSAGLLITLLAQPDQLTITLIPIVIVVPLLFTTQPWRNNIVIIVCDIIYLCIAPFVKDSEDLVLDIVDVVAFSGLGMVIGNIMTKNKLDRLLFAQESENSKNNITRIIQSFSGMYNSMHYINLVENTIVEYQTNEIISAVLKQENISIAEKMSMVMKQTICEESLNDALEFTDLSTVSKRIKDQKNISIDVLGKYIGWVRLEFITTELDRKSNTTAVIFTTRSIEEEKKKLDEIVNESMTDSLTNCYNRKAFDNDINSLDNLDNLVYISLDVNGLKIVNDTKGHLAGDELLSGAAICISQAFGLFGKVYRTGGDEFVAIIRANDNLLFNLKKNFLNIMDNWSGKLVSDLHISAGYVSVNEKLNLEINEMIKLADERMYEDKSNYYKRNGVNRKEQNDAFMLICRTYTKILKCDLLNDTYRIVNLTAKEKDSASFNNSLSAWFKAFADEGNVHEDSIEEYNKYTNLEYLRGCLLNGNKSVITIYKRRYEDHFEDAVMEIVPATEFSLENQIVYLYVKSINR